MRPRIVTQDAFDVVGEEGYFPPARIPEIAAMWERFVRRIPEVADRAGPECYGLCQGEVPDAAGTACLWYMAAVPVTAGAATRPVPAGLRAYRVPGGTFAVFVHEGHVSTIGQTFDAIFQSWLPAAGLRPACAPGWERYDDRFDGRTGTGTVEIWIPVER